VTATNCNAVDAAASGVIASAAFAAASREEFARTATSFRVLTLLTVFAEPGLAVFCPTANGRHTRKKVTSSAAKRA
jgi:hypothetical protein